MDFELTEPIENARTSFCYCANVQSHMRGIAKRLSPSNFVFQTRFLLRVMGPRTIRTAIRARQSARYLFSRIVDRRRTIVPKRLLTAVQDGTLRYEYQGVRCTKNPFDLALYLKLLWDLKPQTIIEIGSAAGGSGRFFSDQSGLFGLDASVWSFDVHPVIGLDRPNLKFLYGDIHSLESSALPEILKTAKRPLLVVEDGPHTYEGCKAALTFFHEFLDVGDYIVVEDGNLRELGYLSLEDGPNRAIKEFLGRRGAEYEVDLRYCDQFGRNVTWNTDGYLRRIG